MLSSFWRRKNGRLVKRLNAAIEATERLSEVYNAPKPPRVVIDTSYVERKPRQPTITHNHDDDTNPVEPPMAMTGMPVHIDQPGHDQGADEHGRAEWRHAAHAELAGALRDYSNAAQNTGEAWDGDISLLQEAAQQLEQAEQRETEALQQLEDLRRKAEELEASLATEREARRTAETARDKEKAAAAATAAELAALQSSPPTSTTSPAAETEARTRLEAKLILEQAARREAEAQRDGARQQVSQVNEEIESLRKALAEAAAEKAKIEANATDSETLKEITALRSRNEELAADAARAREALSRTESDIKTARKATEAARKETFDLRHAAARVGEIEKELAEVRTREADYAAQAKSLASRIAEFDAKIAGIDTERAAERERTAQEGDRAAAEIGALRLAAEHLTKQRTSENAEASKRQQSLVKDVETLRAKIANLEGSRNKEREASERDLEKANEEIASLRAAAQKLTDKKVQEGSEADKRATEALAQSDNLRQQIAKIEESHRSERQAAADAAVEAAAEIESLRLAAQEIATSHLQQATEEAAKISALQNELEALRKRADELDAALSAAEAARLSAEFDRDNARREAQQSETRLAALRNPMPAQSSAPESSLAESPPVFKTASVASAAPALPTIHPRLRGDKHAQATASVLAAVAEDASPRAGGTDTSAARYDEPIASRHNTIMSPPPLSQASVPVTGDTDDTITPAKSDSTGYSSEPTGPAAETEDVDWRGREKRVASRMAVTLWTEAWGQPLSCFLVDKSSRGAKIEMKPDRIFGGNNRINVGDRLTLTFYYPQERTSVFCDVMWMDGNFLGVKYYGQFHTEFNKPRAQRR